MSIPMNCSENYVNRLCNNKVVVDFLLTNHSHLTTKQICNALNISKNSLTQVAKKINISLIEPDEENELTCVGKSIGAVTADTVIHTWAGGITVRTPINDNGIVSVTRHLTGIRNKTVDNAFTLPVKSILHPERKKKILTKHDDIAPKQFHHFNVPIMSSKDSEKTNIKIQKLMKASI